MLNRRDFMVNSFATSIAVPLSDACFSLSTPLFQKLRGFLIADLFDVVDAPSHDEDGMWLPIETDCEECGIDRKHNVMLPTPVRPTNEMSVEETCLQLLVAVGMNNIKVVFPDKNSTRPKLFLGNGGLSPFNMDSMTHLIVEPGLEARLDHTYLKNLPLKATVYDFRAAGFYDTLRCYLTPQELNTPYLSMANERQLAMAVSKSCGRPTIVRGNGRLGFIVFCGHSVHLAHI